MKKQSIRWVRAGHEPAIFYDPGSDTFDELKGAGMALGVDDGWQYEEKQKSESARGQIIVFGTDGIWESHNAAGELFGKKSLYNIIRDCAAGSAKDIVDAIMTALGHFRRGVVPEYDVTLVVVKVVV